MSKQFSLLSSAGAGTESRFNVFFEPIHVSQSTFLAGLSAHIHRWFRLTPSFGPDLVREMLGELAVSKGELLLDPFSGAATTAMEAKLHDYDSVGFEINPFLQFVGRVSTDWTVAHRAAESALADLVKKFPGARRKVTFDSLAEAGYQEPPIHNATRWWRPDVMTDLLVLLRLIDDCAPNKKVRDFLRLGVAGVLVPDLTNVTLGRLQLHFIDRSTHTIDVVETFKNHVTNMLHDLRSAQQLPNVGTAEILSQDSTDLANVALARRIDAVITSPPYPNRYSYIWNTRPHLYLLGFMTSPGEASAVDKQTIGGTWGTATSELQKGVFEPLNPAVAATIGAMAAQIRKSDNLMANYAVHYFNRIARHLLELERIVAPNVRVAYVVGNSWLKGVYIETDVLLAELLERLDVGYKVRKIHRFRRRHSGERLFESVVYAAK